MNSCYKGYRSVSLVAKSKKDRQARLKKGKASRPEHVTREVPDVVGDDIKKLRELFPQVFSEGKIDFEKLRVVLGESSDKSPDRFTFSWAGKRDAIQILQIPTRATLIPVEKESVNFDTTNN